MLCFERHLRSPETKQLKDTSGIRLVLNKQCGVKACLETIVHVGYSGVCVICPKKWKRVQAIADELACIISNWL